MGRVVAAVFQSLAEAQIARARLESEGIAAIIPDENAVQLYPSLTVIKPVRLEVEEADLPHAKRLLKTEPETEPESDT